MNKRQKKKNIKNALKRLEQGKLTMKDFVVFETYGRKTMEEIKEANRFIAKISREAEKKKTYEQQYYQQIHSTKREETKKQNSIEQVFKSMGKALNTFFRGAISG